VLLATSLLQLAVFLVSDSVALLTDVIHNGGDALTAIPLGIAFIMRSRQGERWAGYCIVAVILASALLALVQVIERFIHPQTPTHLWALLAAGIIGVVGNEVRGHHSLESGPTTRLTCPSSQTATTPAPTVTSAQASSSPPRSSLRGFLSPTRSSAFSSPH